MEGPAEGSENSNIQFSILKRAACVIVRILSVFVFVVVVDRLDITALVDWA